jgi:heme oxygenase
VTISQAQLTGSPVNRAAMLKAGTADLHERLDKRIIGHRPFENAKRYGRFLRVQYRFQNAVETVCDEAVLAGFVADIAERRRLHLIAQDLADLGLPAPADEPSTLPSSDPAEMLGWLYVAEGSTLGAAFLLKEAKKLGLDETFGARHMAPHPEGRGLHWKRFQQALDAADIGPTGDAAATHAAGAAFALVSDLVEVEFA